MSEEIKRRVVVFPIKCSTVRRLDDKLNWLSYRLFIIAWFAGAAWSVTMNYYAVSVRFISNAEVPALLMSWVLLAGSAIALFIYITDHFPVIECIKDEPEDKQ